MAEGNLLIRIGADASKLMKTLKQTENRLNRSGRRFAEIGDQLSMSFSLPLAAIGVASIKAAADFERLEKGLTATMGSTEAAREEMEKLRKVAEAPGLGFEQAIAGSMRLQAVGMSAEEARVTLSEMGNAIAMSGGGAEDLDAVTRQLTQMISKNRVLQEDFGVLQERIPKVGEAMERAFKTQNIEDIRKAGIGAEEFIKGITAAMSEMPRVEGGLANSLENIRITAKVAMAEIGTAINENFDIQGIVENFGKNISNAIEWFGNLSDGAKKAIFVLGGFLITIGPIMKVIGAVKLLGAALAALATSGGWIGLAITAIAGLITWLVQLDSETGKVSATLTGIGNVMVELGKIITESLRKPFEGMSFLMAGEFKKAQKAFGDYFATMSPVAIAFTQGERLGQAFDKGYNKSMMNFRVKQLEKHIASQKQAGETGASAMVQALKDELNSLMADVEDAGGKAGKKLSEGAEKEIKQNGPAFLTPAIDSLFMQGAKNVGVLGVQAASVFIKNAATTLQNVSGPLASSFKSLFDQLLAGMNDIGMQDKFADVFRGVLKGVETFDTIFESLNQAFDAFTANRQASIDATYEKEKARIEATKMSEEAKQNAIQRLEEQTDKKRRKLARSQAIREKLLGIVSATINTAKGITGALPNLVLAGIVGALGAAQIALIASQKIPALATGGLAYGPTMAMVGDNASARVDPEVIAPLSKLRDMIGGAQRVEVVGRISGRDLLLIQERAAQDMKRTRGY